MSSLILRLAPRRRTISCLKVTNKYKWWVLSSHTWDIPWLPGTSHLCKSHNLPPGIYLCSSHHQTFYAWMDLRKKKLAFCLGCVGTNLRWCQSCKEHCDSCLSAVLGSFLVLCAALELWLEEDFVCLECSGSSDWMDELDVLQAAFWLVGKVFSALVLPVVDHFSWLTRSDLYSPAVAVLHPSACFHPSGCHSCTYHSQNCHNHQTLPGHRQ